MQPLLSSLMWLLLAVVMISIWATLFVLYQVIKQQGRVLLRLDGIEQQIKALAAPSAPTVVEGLPVGEPFPAFKLPNLNGNEVALEDFSDRKVLVVNWNPNCRLLYQDRSRVRQAQAGFSLLKMLSWHSPAAVTPKPIASWRGSTASRPQSCCGRPLQPCRHSKTVELQSLISSTKKDTWQRHWLSGQTRCLR